MPSSPSSGSSSSVVESGRSSVSTASKPSASRSSSASSSSGRTKKRKMDPDFEYSHEDTQEQAEEEEEEEAASPSNKRRGSSKARSPDSAATAGLSAAEIKRLRRQQQNRDAAATSRHRKKAYLQSLENKVSSLEGENARLQEQVEQQAKVIEALRIQLAAAAAAGGATAGAAGVAPGTEVRPSFVSVVSLSSTATSPQPSLAEDSLHSTPTSPHSGAETDALSPSRFSAASSAASAHSIHSSPSVRPQPTCASPLEIGLVLSMSSSLPLLDEELPPLSSPLHMHKHPSYDLPQHVRAMQHMVAPTPQHTHNMHMQQTTQSVMPAPSPMPSPPLPPTSYSSSSLAPPPSSSFYPVRPESPYASVFAAEYNSRPDAGHTSFSVAPTAVASSSPSSAASLSGVSSCPTTPSPSSSCSSPSASPPSSSPLLRSLSGYYDPAVVCHDFVSVEEGEAERLAGRGQVSSGRQGRAHADSRVHEHVQHSHGSSSGSGMECGGNGWMECAEAFFPSLPNDFMQVADSIYGH